MKAVFSDFYGTLVKEESPTSIEVTNRIYKNGTGESFEDVARYWWSDYRERIAKACGKDWQSQQALSLDTLEHLMVHFECSEDAVELRDIMNKHWCNPLIYDDAKRFLCGLQDLEVPVYFVTNSDDIYINESMKNHQITCDGVITSEKAKYSKPRPEIFRYALESFGLQAEEVVHIGDSIGSDVACPSSLGIQAIWLNRGGAEVPKGVLAVDNLDEALGVLKTL